MTNIWVDKYRPSEFSEVKGQEEIIKRLDAFVKEKNVPHLLFGGPPGVGKSTCALIVAKTLFGESWRENFLELNASDSRKIDDVRTTIKSYVKTKSFLSDVPKIIFLDEADALTKDAQNALRRMMEQYSNTARFILSCNYSSKIIEALQSRCVMFRFKPLSKDAVYSLIEDLSSKEELKVDDKSKESLYVISKGDARRVENVLQSCSVINKNITDDLIHEVVSAAKPEEVKEVLSLSVQGQFVPARKKLLDTMLSYGLSGLDIIKQIQQEILTLEIEDSIKLKMIEKCGEVEFRMVEGSDDFVQLESLLASFGGFNAVNK